MPTTPSAAQAHAQKIAEEYVPSDDRKQAVLSEDHPPPPVDEEKEVVRLAKLATVQYEREREAAAATLKIRVAVVDKLVKAACQGASPGQGRKVELQEIDPWPDPVDGAVLLDEISTAIYEHIHLSPQQADTCALYSVYAHAYHVFRVAPRLGVRAPPRK